MATPQEDRKDLYKRVAVLVKKLLKEFAIKFLSEDKVLVHVYEYLGVDQATIGNH